MINNAILPSTKLTLSLSKSAISFAKKYASSVGKSVSALTEDFFNSLNVSSNAHNLELTPIVSEIAGVISQEQASEVDYKSEYVDYLESKYGK